jgi:hypothetical protein
MSQTIESLLKQNLHAVFDERDAQKRRAAIPQSGLKMRSSSILTDLISGRRHWMRPSSRFRHGLQAFHGIGRLGDRAAGVGIRTAE